MTGQQLKNLRHRAMLSQLELACMLGLNQTNIGKWETGAEPIPAYRVEEIKQAIRESTTTVYASARSIEPEKRKPPKPMTVDDSLCRAGCKYWRTVADTTDKHGGAKCCHYILDTGKRRGCEGGSKCDKYDRSKRVKKRWLDC